jgi:hypothetical protein
MTKRLNADQRFELANGFRELAKKVGDYNFENWSDLNKKQRDALSHLELRLLETASDINANSIVLRSKMVEDEVRQLQRVASKLKTVKLKTESIQKILTLSSSVLAFAGALVTGNVKDIIGFGNDIVSGI